MFRILVTVFLLCKLSPLLSAVIEVEGMDVRLWTICKGDKGIWLLTSQGERLTTPFDVFDVWFFSRQQELDKRYELKFSSAEKYSAGRVFCSSGDQGLTVYVQADGLYEYKLSERGVTERKLFDPVGHVSSITILEGKLTVVTGMGVFIEDNGTFVQVPSSGSIVMSSIDDDGNIFGLRTNELKTIKALHGSFELGRGEILDSTDEITVPALANTDQIPTFVLPRLVMSDRRLGVLFHTMNGSEIGLLMATNKFDLSRHREYRIPLGEGITNLAIPSAVIVGLDLHFLARRNERPHRRLEVVTVRNGRITGSRTLTKHAGYSNVSGFHENAMVYNDGGLYVAASTFVTVVIDDQFWSRSVVTVEFVSL